MEKSVPPRLTDGSSSRAATRVKTPNTEVLTGFCRRECGGGSGSMPPMWQPLWRPCLPKIHLGGPEQQCFVVTLQSNGLLSCIIGFIQIHEDEVGNKDKAVDSLSVHTLTSSFIKKTELFNSNVSGFVIYHKNRGLTWKSLKFNKINFK